MTQRRNTPSGTASGNAGGNEAGDRRLTARSVVLSTLLGTQPPRLRTLLLVRACGLFGISEGTARVALSRMVASGELVVDGRHHALGDRLRRRQARQDSSRAAAVGRWHRERWITAVVTAGSRSAGDRAELRAAFHDHRMAELREGVWLRPDNLATEPFATDVCTWFRSTPDDDAAALAAGLWDLSGWAATADALLARMARLQPALDGHDTAALAPGFVLSAAVLRHFQADPLLPAALLPDGWSGPALRREYDRFDAAYRAVLSEWFRVSSDDA